MFLIPWMKWINIFSRSKFITGHQFGKSHLAEYHGSLGPAPPTDIQLSSTFRCPGDGHFRHAVYCEVFYQCRGGRVTKRQCPRDTVYNVKFNVCEYSPATSCQPYSKSTHDYGAESYGHSDSSYDFSKYRNTGSGHSSLNSHSSLDNSHDSSIDFISGGNADDKYNYRVSNYDEYGTFNPSTFKIYEYGNNKKDKHIKSQNEVYKPSTWNSYNSVGMGFPIFIF